MDVGAELLALGQHLVEIVLTQNSAHCRLCEHIGRVQIVLHLNAGTLRIDDIEIEDSVNLHRHIVARNYVLARNVDDLGAQVDTNHLLDDRNKQDQSGPFHSRETAQREHHGALILTQYFDACHSKSEQCEAEDRKQKGGGFKHLAFLKRGPARCCEICILSCSALVKRQNKSSWLQALNPNQDPKTKPLASSHEGMVIVSHID